MRLLERRNKNGRSIRSLEPGTIVPLMRVAEVAVHRFCIDADIRGGGPGGGDGDGPDVACSVPCSGVSSSSGFSTGREGRGGEHKSNDIAPVLHRDARDSVIFWLPCSLSRLFLARRTSSLEAFEFDVLAPTE